MALRKGVWSSFLGFLISCGIKSDTRPIQEPRFEIYRVGKSVYIKPLEENISVEGFSNVGPYLVFQKEEGFCFTIKSKRSSAKRCVKEAKTQVPSFRLQKLNDLNYVYPEGDGEFALFILKDGVVNLSKSIKISEPLSSGCYWLVRKYQDSFSEPNEFCIKGEKPKEVSDVRIYTLGGRKYITWRYEGEYLKFVILLDGKEVYSTTGFYAPLFESGEVAIQVVGKDGERGRAIKVFP